MPPNPKMMTKGITKSLTAKSTLEADSEQIAPADLDFVHPLRWSKGHTCNVPASLGKCCNPHATVTMNLTET
jgi:hypothetical protein